METVYREPVVVVKPPVKKRRTVKNKLRNVLGSNQYRTRRRNENNYKGVLMAYLVFGILLFAAVQSGKLYFNKQELLNPVVSAEEKVVKIDAVVTSTPSATATPSATPSAIKNAVYDEIRADIVAVFGSHAPKAFKLLSCENSSLNPNAVNHNKDAVKSTDYGVFQINDYWQGIRHDGKAQQLLLDPKINVRIAWRLYEDNGYQFGLWTCGRKLGI